MAETAIFRLKTLLGGHLSLSDYDAQVGEAISMVKALNRITLFRNAEQHQNRVTVGPLGAKSSQVLIYSTKPIRTYIHILGGYAKIACFSALACVLAVAAGSATADERTVFAGYAQGDLQGVANKANGFNLKYRYEWDNDQPLGVISSFTYIEKNRAESGDYDKGQYYCFTACTA